MEARYHLTSINRHDNMSFKGVFTMRERAVYYNRVSTEEESQVNALANQIRESEDCINEHDWELVDKYIDEGRSGTQTKKRDEYNRLLTDLETDKFDIVVIKSQDRLNRNTKDWYLFVDKLVTNKKKLFFYLDNKFYTPEDSLITGIKAILAEDYSRELSKKLNNAHRKRQAKGKVLVITSNTWGFDKNKITKEVTVNKKEAKIINLILDLCIAGYGSRSISKELSNRGIKSRTGKDFAEVTIRKIIRNPLYMGTAIMNKTHIDFDTKETIHNPKEEWIYHENAVPAIVTEEKFVKANKIMDSRSQQVHSDTFGKRVLGKNIGKSDLSSKIYCGECNSVYWRRYRKNVRGEQIVDWSCSEYVKRGRKKADTRGKNLLKVTAEGGCDNIHLNEKYLNNILTKLANDLFDTNNNYVDHVMSILKSTLEENNDVDQQNMIKEDKEKILYQKNLLLDKLLEGIISNDDYKRKDTEFENKLMDLLEQEKLINDKAEDLQKLDERIEHLRTSLENGGSNESTLKILTDHISKIIVYKEYIEVYLDFYDMVVINLDKKSKKNKPKNVLYVETAIYLIPHTDKYRHAGQYKEVNVKICI